MRNCCWKEAKRKPLRKKPHRETLFLFECFFFLFCYGSFNCGLDCCCTHTKKINKERGCREREGGKREGEKSVKREVCSTNQFDSWCSKKKNNWWWYAKKKRIWGKEKKSKWNFSGSNWRRGVGDALFWRLFFFFGWEKLVAQKKIQKTLLVKWGTRSCVCCGMEKNCCSLSTCYFCFPKKNKGKKKQQQRLAVVWGSAANVERSLTILPFLGFDCHNEKCVGYFVYTHNILKFLERISHTRKSRSATNENKENQKKVWIRNRGSWRRKKCKKW